MRSKILLLYILIFLVPLSIGWYQGEEGGGSGFNEAADYSPTGNWTNSGTWRFTSSDSAIVMNTPGQSGGNRIYTCLNGSVHNGDEWIQSPTDNNLSIMVRDIKGFSMSYYTTTLNTGFTLNGVFALTNSIRGSDSFVTTAQTDTITLTGAEADDIVLVTLTGTGYNVNDIIQVEKLAGSFVLHRNAGGTSGLTYDWIVIDTD